MMMNINITRMMVVMALVMVMTDDANIKLDKPEFYIKYNIL